MRIKYKLSTLLTRTALKKASWHDYQEWLKRSARQKKRVERIPKYVCFLLICIIVTYGIIGRNEKSAKSHSKNNYTFASILSSITGSNSRNEPPLNDKRLIGKISVQTLLDSNIILNLRDKRFDVDRNGRRYHVDTSLDISLQNFMLRTIDRTTSIHVGIVAMDPAEGRILAMVGFDKTDPLNNPCTDSRFPAASIFKIITAAAAIEKFDYSVGSYFTYNGRKHTLYKSQIAERSNRYTKRITLRDSFAQSVNPVFGKLGAFYLGKTDLEKYATAFGFNQDIEFEIQLPTSFVSLSDDFYQWAEVASGFNRETTISPIHGALITSAILNRGTLLEPTIIDRITDENGEAVYSSHTTVINQAITPKTSMIMNDLMVATIRSGTCKKVFKGYQKDSILSRLNIGGKSGSINSRIKNQRHDWFVGFAEEKDGSEKLVISIVVTHNKYIGKRAARYARIAIRHYFGNYFAQVELKRRA